MVAGAVAETVIHGFETIQVEIQERDHMFAALSLCQGIFQVIEQQRAVGQTR